MAHDAVYDAIEDEHEAIIEAKKKEAEMNLMASLIAQKIVEALKPTEPAGREPDIETNACKPKKREDDYYSEYEDRINKLRK